MKTGGDPECRRHEDRRRTGKLHLNLEECRNIYSKEVLSEAMNA